MKFNLSEIKLSRKDLKKGLTLPTEMNEKLAEDIGIMIGDGGIGIYKYKNLTNSIVSIDGNSITDKEYLLNYVKNLKFRLYNLNFKPYFKKNRNEMRIRTYSKGLVEFYTKVIGLPLGKKTNVGIPPCVWNDNKFIKACLRGIIDTDGNFQLRINNYPQIKLGVSSKKLIEDCKRAFALLGIKTSIKTDCTHIHCITKRPYVTNYLYLSGREKFSKYIKLIGFSNPNNLLKYNLWKNSSFRPRPYIIRKNNGPSEISTRDPMMTPNIRVMCSKQAELWALKHI